MPPREKNFWDTLRQIDQTRREGKSVLVQPDDEKRLQGATGWMEVEANGCQDQEQRRTKSII